MDERVGMPIQQLPFGSVTAVDLGDPQRPFLVRQTAHLPVLPLDHNENNKVARCVGLHHVQLCLAGFEVVSGLEQALAAVLVAGGLSAEGIHQREPWRMGREREVTVHVAAHEHRRGFLRALTSSASSSSVMLPCAMAASCDSLCPLTDPTSGMVFSVVGAVHNLWSAWLTMFRPARRVP
jgi:hypothetical protein